MLSHFSHVRLYATPWTVALQVPLSMGILHVRILEWTAISFSGGSSQPRIEPGLLHRRQTFYLLSHQGSPNSTKRYQTLYQVKIL